MAEWDGITGVRQRVPCDETDGGRWEAEREKPRVGRRVRVCAAHGEEDEQRRVQRRRARVVETEEDPK